MTEPPSWGISAYGTVFAGPAVGEEREPLACRADDLGIDVREDERLTAGRERQHLAERVDHTRVTRVGEPPAGPDPVHAEDVRLVLDRACTQQHLPVQPAAL